MPTIEFQYEEQVLGSNSVQLWGTVTGAPGTRVEIYSGSTDLGAANITASGTWGFATPNLAPGNYSFSAVATSPGGATATFSGIPSLTAGAVTGTLNPSRYTTVWQQDFTRSAQIDSTIFPIKFGNPDEFSFGANGLTLTSYRSEGFNNVGFLQADWGASLGQGYGLYSVTASHPANQGSGIAILLWPSDNIWPGPEMDLVEDWNDPTSQTNYVTIHFKGPTGKDMGNSIRMPVDLTQSNTFALDWERGSLTYYINGQELLRITGSEVPLDAADGGVNASFGAEIANIGTSYQPSDRVSLTIASMSYSAVNPTWSAGPSQLVLQSGGTVVDWVISKGQLQSTSTISSSAAGFSVVGKADFNGDGSTDILLQSAGTVVDWILKDGAYQSGNVITTAATGYTVVGTGDFNADGTSDVLLQNGGTIVDWIMKNGVYQSGNIITTAAAGWTVVGTGDFDNDGTTDVLLQNGGTVVDWVMQNGAYRAANVLSTAAQGWTVVGTGDFNGDGTSDVLLQNGGTVVDWIMQNGAYQSGNVITTAAAGFKVVATGDYNGDGTSDVMLQGGNLLVDWLMAGGQYQSGSVVSTSVTGFSVK